MSKIKVKKPNGSIVEIPLGSTINIGSDITVDQTFSPTSENPQSGIAVNQAIAEQIGEISSALDQLHEYAIALTEVNAE